ncbi:MAG: hypothetical protein AAGA55_04720 [Planctomycetota bacterium]
MPQTSPPILLDASRLGAQIETSGAPGDPRYRKVGVVIRIDHELLSKVSQSGDDDFGNWALALAVKKVFFETETADAEAARLNQEREFQNEQRGLVKHCSYWSTTAKIDRRELETIAARQRLESKHA